MGGMDETVITDWRVEPWVWFALMGIAIVVCVVVTAVVVLANRQRDDNST
jgi:hypothetical protein